jgi:hypothetical protein
MTARPAENKINPVASGGKPPTAGPAGPDEGAHKKAPGECVVDDGTAHMGRAVNGVVCSAHAMRYKSDGTPRP